MTEVGDASLQARRWRRYGKDYLYVSESDGTKVGRLDLLSGAVVLDQEGRRAEFDVVVAAWIAEHEVVVPEADDAGAEEVLVDEVDAEATDDPADDPAEDHDEDGEEGDGDDHDDDRGWVDLAENRPGQAARQQAIELKQQAPIRTFIARALNVHTDERAWRIGAAGEQEVAWRLRKLDEGWHLLHAVPVGENGGDIDHLVIGPGGVYTLNTKNHPGGKVWVAERSFMVNGQRTQYLRNSRFEASRAAKLLGAACGFEVAVEPIIVLLCAEITIKSRPEGVHVVSHRRIRKWLTKRPPVLGPEQVQAVYDHARRDITWRT
jgi:hypothetical protein